MAGCKKINSIQLVLPTNVDEWDEYIHHISTDKLRELYIIFDMYANKVLENINDLERMCYESVMGEIFQRFVEKKIKWV